MKSPDSQSWKSRLAGFLARWNSRRWQPPAEPVQFPISAGQIHRVLAILPGQLEHLDRATAFVYRLRQRYPRWEIDLFDPDKIPDRQLGLSGLPRRPFLEQLRQEGYDLVINLSACGDVYRNYLVLASGAPYRLALFPERGPSYNITCLAGKGELEYELLLDAIQQLFVSPTSQAAL